MSQIEDVKAAVAWAREVHALGIRIIYAHPRRTTAHTMAVPMMMTSRALNALDSVVLLVEAGHTTDAFSIMRSVCELAIDLSYIAESDTEARMELFGNHIFVARHRLMKAIGAAAGESKQAAEFASRMETIYERIKDNYGNKANWANKRIDHRAAEAGMTTFYELMHRLGSGASHSCAEALWWECATTSVNGEETIVSSIGDYSKPMAEPLLFASLALFSVLTTLVGLLGLDFNSELVAVMARSPTIDNREDYLSEMAQLGVQPSPAATV